MPAEVRGTDKATFFSLSDERSLPAPSDINLKEREFVVDSGASMHMVSRNDLNSAELETVRISKSPTTVEQANGKALTKEEATFFVQGIGFFVAILSLGKLCEDHGRITIGKVVENHIPSKMEGRSIATKRTTYPSLSVVYRQALQAHLHLHLLHLHRKKP